MSPQPYRELIMSKWNEPEVPTIELSHQNLFEDRGPIDKIIGYPIYARLILTCHKQNVLCETKALSERRHIVPIRVCPSARLHRDNATTCQKNDSIWTKSHWIVLASFDASKTFWILSWLEYFGGECGCGVAPTWISSDIGHPALSPICEENSPVTGGFPAQGASNAENPSIWWRHHKFVPYCEVIASPVTWHEINGCLNTKWFLPLSTTESISMY